MESNELRKRKNETAQNKSSVIQKTKEKVQIETKTPKPSSNQFGTRDFTDFT